MKLLVIADPLATFKTHKDSTFAMLREAGRRGHQLFAMEAREMVLRERTVSGFAAAVTLKVPGADPYDWFEASEPSLMPLSAFDIVLMAICCSISPFGSPLVLSINSLKDFRIWSSLSMFIGYPINLQNLANSNNLS